MRAEESKRYYQHALLSSLFVYRTCSNMRPSKPEECYRRLLSWPTTQTWDVSFYFILFYFFFYLPSLSLHSAGVWAEIKMKENKYKETKVCNKCVSLSLSIQQCFITVALRPVLEPSKIIKANLFGINKPLDVCCVRSCNSIIYQM